MESGRPTLDQLQTMITSVITSPLGTVSFENSYRMAYRYCRNHGKDILELIGKIQEWIVDMYWRGSAVLDLMTAIQMVYDVLLYPMRIAHISEEQFEKQIRDRLMKRIQPMRYITSYRNRRS